MDKVYRPLKGSKRVNKLAQGQTVYIVHAFGRYARLDTIKVQSKAKAMVFEGDSVVFNCVIGEDDRLILLCDYGWTSESYNNHRLFTSRRKANSYLKLCNVLGRASK